MDPELTDLLRRAQQGDAVAMGEIALAFREAAMSAALQATPRTPATRSNG